MLTAHNVSVTYPATRGRARRTVLNNVSCELIPGRITCFVGKSGAGKTSLLQVLAHLNTEYQGIVLASEHNIALFSPEQRAATVGFVFQNFNLFPHLTVVENCIQPLVAVKKLSVAEAQKKAHEVLQSLDMIEYQHAYPTHLSGGQQQRVAIARALCLNPQVLLLDEPTSALDPANVAQLQILLRMLASHGITIALSSHDMQFVEGILDRVYLIDEGSIVESFDREVLTLNTDTPRLHQFLNMKDTN